MGVTASYQRQNNVQGAQRFTMWLAILSVMMIFAGFTSAFVVRKGAAGNWSSFMMPKIFNVATFVILLSSAFLYVAHTANKKGNKKLMAAGLWITLGLGILFCILQIMGWGALYNQGVYLAFSPNPAGSFFYVITFMHFIHVAGGLIFLLIASFHALIQLKTTDKTILIELEDKEKGIYTLRTDLLSMYWHFMGLLWLYLFIFLYLNFNH